MNRSTPRTAASGASLRGALLLLVLLVLLGASCAAASLNAEMQGDATAVLRFLATDVTAEIRGTAAVEDTIAIEERSVHVACHGPIWGEGGGDSYTLDAAGWAVSDLAGAAAGSQTGSVRLRGVLRLSASGISSGSTSAVAAGSFVAVLEIGSDVWKLAGTVSATVTAEVVAPEIKYTMQVEAAYRLALNGEAAALPGVPDGAAAETLLVDGWPAEARDAFRGLFDPAAGSPPAP